MSADSFCVFLSSTSDLATERQAIAEFAPRSFRVYRYERDRPRLQSPEQRLERVLEEETDVFVGLYGERYGSPYPDCEERRAIVEWEFDRAKELPVEIQGFVKDPLDQQRLEEPQREFLERIGHFRKGSWLGRFGSVDVLTREVNTALLEWLDEVHVREKAAWNEERATLHKHQRVLRGLFAGALALVFVATITVTVFSRAWWAAAGVAILTAVLSIGYVIMLSDPPEADQ